MNRVCSSPVRLWVSEAVRGRILRVERSWNGPHRDWASEKDGPPAGGHRGSAGARGAQPDRGGAAVVAQRERCCPGLPPGTVRSTRRLRQAVAIAWWYSDGQAAMLDAVRATRMACASGDLLVAAGEPQSVGRTRLEGVRWHRTWYFYASRRSGIFLARRDLERSAPSPRPRA